MFSILYLFTALNQGNLIVTLNNEAKDAQGSMAGNYILAPNMVNEKKHWLQQGGWFSGTNVMWFSKCGFWSIGPQSSVSQNDCISGLYAPGDSTGPDTATGWKYARDDGSSHEPSNDNDILVELGNTTTVL